MAYHRYAASFPHTFLLLPIPVDLFFLRITALPVTLRFFVPFYAPVYTFPFCAFYLPTRGLCVPAAATFRTILPAMHAVPACLPLLHGARYHLLLPFSLPHYYTPHFAYFRHFHRHGLPAPPFCRDHIHLPTHSLLFYNQPRTHCHLHALPLFRFLRYCGRSCCGLDSAGVPLPGFYACVRCLYWFCAFNIFWTVLRARYSRAAPALHAAYMPAVSH